MFALKCIKPAFFDVDSTLMEWGPSEDKREEDGVACKWPIHTLSMSEDGHVFIKEQFEEDAYIPLHGNIEELKEHKRRGHTVIVWSSGGWQWAEKAVKMLGLEDYVDLVMEKPASVYDDKALEEFMPPVQFMKELPPMKEDEPKKEKRANRDEAQEDSPSPTWRVTDRLTTSRDR